MGIINGVYASAEIFSEQVEEYAVAQIQMICDNKASEGSVIRVMPDVHPGKVGTIGLTMTVGERVLPNLVGIDIGCGITLTKLKQKKTEFQKLDTVSGKMYRQAVISAEKHTAGVQNLTVKPYCVFGISMRIGQEEVSAHWAAAIISLS